MEVDVDERRRGVAGKFKYLCSVTVGNGERHRCSTRTADTLLMQRVQRAACRSVPLVQSCAELQIKAKKSYVEEDSIP
jgi:hypothetical protein